MGHAAAVTDDVEIFVEGLEIFVKLNLHIVELDLNTVKQSVVVGGTGQESSPTPQFKSINSSALSFLHSPTLTSIHDHWKNHSLD